MVFRLNNASKTLKLWRPGCHGPCCTAYRQCAPVLLIHWRKSCWYISHCWTSLGLGSFIKDTHTGERLSQL